MTNNDWTQKPITFFFGAGATKAVIKNAPLGNQLLLNILTYRPSTTEFADKTKDLVVKINQFINDVYGEREKSEKSLPRFEDVLSLLDLYTNQKLSLTNKYKYEDIVKLKYDLTFLMCKMLEDKLRYKSVRAMDALKDKLKSITNPKITFISTNYDIVLDNALYDIGMCNYGVIVRNILEREQPDFENADFKIGVGGNESYIKAKTLNYPAYPSKLNKGKIPLYKLHGSLNWLWCPRCQELDITVNEKGALRIQYNYLCSSQFCTSPYEFLITTPTMFKVFDNRIIKEVWKQAEKCISKSKYIVFIGYSLPEADIHIRCMLTRAIASQNYRPKILVINYEDQSNINQDAHKKELYDTEIRYKKLFGHDIKIKRCGFVNFATSIDDIMNNFIAT